ncbi:MAG: quercetin dioxygenase-like cupin family protein [Enterobacterales bacterium]|jgi:quercetin dioxygenase-like cupin family protein
MFCSQFNLRAYFYAAFNGEKVKIKKGDMILNEPNGEHGLVNYSEYEIELLIMQARL